MKRFIRFAAIIVGGLAASIASAFTFNVTSPNAGTISDPTFLGSTNTVSFSATAVDRELTVTVVATNLDTNTTITREQKFTPTDSKIDSSIPLNFSPGTPEGNYRLDVSAHYTGDPTTTTVTIDNLKLDITKPKILEFNPGTSTFVPAGVVHITAFIQEANFKNYTVQVNGQDIPDNTGTTLVNNELTVNWDTTGITNDGSQTISITITDKANNTSSQSISVTLDRIKPSITIQSPSSSVRARADFNVVVDIQDASTASVDVTGIDVILTRMDGSFLYRVPRVSLNGQSGNTQRWTGRILGKKVTLPKQFKLKVTAVDRAGNIAVTQSTTINVK